MRITQVLINFDQSILKIILRIHSITSQPIKPNFHVSRIVHGMVLPTAFKTFQQFNIPSNNRNCSKKFSKCIMASPAVNIAYSQIPSSTLQAATTRVASAVKRSTALILGRPGGGKGEVMNCCDVKCQC